MDKGAQGYSLNIEPISWHSSSPACSMIGLSNSEPMQPKPRRAISVTVLPHFIYSHLLKTYFLDCLTCTLFASSLGSVNREFRWCQVLTSPGKSEAYSWFSLV